MKDFFKHNGILILVIAALLALIAFLASFLLGGTANPLSNVLGVITTPVRNGVNALASWVEEQYTNAFESDMIREENERLKQENARLQEEAREAQAALRENERMVLSLYYEKELNMKEIAQVLGVSAARISQIHSRALQHLRVHMKQYMQI